MLRWTQSATASASNKKTSTWQSLQESKRNQHFLSCDMMIGSFLPLFYHLFTMFILIVLALFTIQLREMQQKIWRAPRQVPVHPQWPRRHWRDNGWPASFGPEAWRVSGFFGTNSWAVDLSQCIVPQRLMCKFLTIWAGKQKSSRDVDVEFDPSNPTLKSMQSGVLRGLCFILESAENRLPKYSQWMLVTDGHISVSVISYSDKKHALKCWNAAMWQKEKF